MPYSALLRGCGRFTFSRIRLMPPTFAARHLFCKSTTPTFSSSSSSSSSFMKEDQSQNQSQTLCCDPSTGIYVPPIPRLRSVIVSAAGAVTHARCSDRYDDSRSVSAIGGAHHQVLRYNQTSQFSTYVYNDDYSDDDSDHDLEPSTTKSGSTLDNTDGWRWKLTMFLHNEGEQEIVTWERKDRRDYEQIALLASRMGLYSRQYSRVVVFSKVPLPNYRPDLDDRRPQREVSIPFDLQREVDSLLGQYLAHKRYNSGNFLNALSRSSSEDYFPMDEGIPYQQEPQSSPNILLERHLRRRSLYLHDQQQSWMESPAGQKMQRFRQSLPAYKERHTLLSAFSQNQVVVISGETGCGKTTQIPQYILESEIDALRGASCSIICTQPRRISATSVSERVAAERGEKLGESVGYKVRLEGMKGRDTRLLFCTTGVLLRRLLVDRNLKGVSHVIVDEIHERGMNEDFLLIVLKELLLCRPDLKLILMSATINAELFSSYFGGAPMIHIPGFTYSVRTNFLEDVLEITGHRLTPYNQIDYYGPQKPWKMQKRALSKRKSQIASSVEDALETADFRHCSLRTRDSLACWNPESIGFNLIESVLVHICRNERPGAILLFMTGWDDIKALKDQLQSHPLLGDRTKVLLLACHGSMPSSEQRLIFDEPEDGVRKIVLSTNMAETSITINDVVFVVDCGKAKETSYDALNNTSCLLPSWISKASANQRRGRAGRVQPGECYHLYPKCIYNAFAEYQLPELLRTPLQSLCLQIKSLQLGGISDFLSRALQSPEPLSVQNAIEYLQVIGALDEKENLTVLGRHLAMLPVEPKLGKMLIYGCIFNCLDPILTVVAGLGVRDPFYAPFDKKDLADSVRDQFSCQDYSDHLALIRAYDGWREAERDLTGYEYCYRNFLSVQTLKAMDSLRKQFVSLLIDAGLIEEYSATCNRFSKDENVIRAVICAGLFPGVCSVMNKEKSISLKTREDGEVMLHMSSVNGRKSKIPYPWLVFNEKVKVNAVFIRDSTAISDSTLLLFGGKLTRGGLNGHLKILGGYLEFFMNPDIAEMFSILKNELDDFILCKVTNPREENPNSEKLLSIVRLLIREDACSGRFILAQKAGTIGGGGGNGGGGGGGGGGGDNPKSQLQTLIVRAGHGNPTYRTKQINNSQFRARVEVGGMQFVGQPFSSKKLAEQDAAKEALEWLKASSTWDQHLGAGGRSRQPSSGSQYIDRLSFMLKKSNNKHRRRT